MKKIYFLILVFSAFLLSCGSEDSVTSAVTQTPATLTALYDESNTSKSISVGDTLDAYTKNFELTYNDGTSSSSITVTKDMITLDTTTVGEKVATISYNGLTTTTSAIVCTSASAFTVSSNTITAYSGSETSVVVPKYINSTEITTLGNSVFKENATLTSVIVNNITTIGARAFDTCSSLSSVSLPLATSIGNFAFNGCKSLSSVSLPLATSIGVGAFYNCTGLTTVSLPLATSVGIWAFYNCTGLTTVSYPLATSIGGYAFYSCTGLTTVSLPLATSVGDYAFGYTDLSSVSLPLVTSIGVYAFYNCTGLTTVSLPLATSIGNYAFDACSSLTSVRFGTTTPPTFGTAVFQNGGTSKSWTIYVPRGKIISYYNALTIVADTFLNTSEPTFEY